MAIRKLIRVIAEIVTNSIINPYPNHGFTDNALLSKIEKLKFPRVAEKRVRKVWVSFSNSGIEKNKILITIKNMKIIHASMNINMHTCLSILIIISIIGPKVLEAFKI